ncbi:S8 family serine peptidase [Paenibacillus solisilvae]|uniref:S8 family serine peptidase n=1 Tax=Paenibacillus solisilvae TaxID=2486751 RepID=A0ABW0VYY6_9BACL
MSWPPIRAFLNMPKHLTGKGINIAVIDSRFPHHPDIVTNERRNTYTVNTSDSNAEPQIMKQDEGPWSKGLHGLWTAAAAAGSGELSSGHYCGSAPEANLFLLQTGSFYTADDIDTKIGRALSWLKLNWGKYEIRGVVLTVVSARDTGLLPWQADPIRVLCEELAEDGLLIVSSVGNTKELTCDGPASSPSVLSVGGVIVPENGDIQDANPYHCCSGITFEGKWVPEILAPAENIVLPMPFVSEAERMNHFTAPYDELPYGYARTEGTSFSGPIILGAAACIWQAHPEWTASQVRVTMLESCYTNPLWDSLHSGLINVAAAMDFEFSHQKQSKPLSTFDHFQILKQKKVTEQLAVLGDDKEGLGYEAVLSSNIEADAAEIVNQLRTFTWHIAYQVRAASILRLSTIPDISLITELHSLLKDESKYVRMAALHVLNNLPNNWEEFTDELIRLFTDADPNIRYCTMKLATQNKNIRFVNPLILGLMNDALDQSVSTFGAACEALEAITGLSFPPTPEWKEGQCWYSDRSTEARLSIVHQWLKWEDRDLAIVN